MAEYGGIPGSKQLTGGADFWGLRLAELEQICSQLKPPSPPERQGQSKEANGGRPPTVAEHQTAVAMCAMGFSETLPKRYRSFVTKLLQTPLPILAELAAAFNVAASKNGPKHQLAEAILEKFVEAQGLPDSPQLRELTRGKMGYDMDSISAYFQDVSSYAGEDLAATEQAAATPAGPQTTAPKEETEEPARPAPEPREPPPASPQPRAANGASADDILKDVFAHILRMAPDIIHCVPDDVTALLIERLEQLAGKTAQDGTWVEKVYLAGWEAAMQKARAELTQQGGHLDQEVRARVGREILRMTEEMNTAIDAYNTRSAEVTEEHGKALAAVHSVNNERADNQTNLEARLGQIIRSYGNAGGKDH
ncbi:hypothetical protein B0T22DRAFT_479888 [Podospora appendiculata]|uniref:Uncharacterized protein n=1 Tax=Podospora appendiculata TaxID=314037 RepID=A0AAE0XAB3_9PEZI|nr:hypothetical protein B0T22DRAFT_479888 [Podospora appendiculata]